MKLLFRWWRKPDVEDSRDEPPVAQPASEPAARAESLAVSRPPLWIVRGRDTFAREDYLIGAYQTRAEAEAAVRAAERRVAYQDKSLRDRFAIIPPEGEPGTLD